MTVDELLEKELAELQKEVIRRHEQAGQSTTGKTKRGFSHSVNSGKGILEGYDYSGVLERGRKPRNSTTESKEFFDNLKEWIKIRGLKYKDEKDLIRLTKFLRWYINKNGTKLFRSGKTVDIFTTPIEQMTERITKELQSIYEIEIKNNIFQ